MTTIKPSKYNPPAYNMPQIVAPDYSYGKSNKKLERSALASKGSLGMYKGKLAAEPTGSGNQNGDYYYDTTIAKIRVFNASDQTRNP